MHYLNPGSWLAILVAGPWGCSACETGHVGTFDELTWRGLVHQSTDPALAEHLNGKGLVAYIGFDPTADSLHIGHLLQLSNLRRLQEGGHIPIALAGGATGMIGDPGGRTEERQLLTMEQLAHNTTSLKAQMARFLEFGDGTGRDGKAILANNHAWLSTIGYLEFLRDVGKLFSVNAMLAKESVSSRLGRDHGISYTEFSYQLLQAYDFGQLYDQFKCTLQMGASDQWGNIVGGVEYVRRTRQAHVFGLTTPLVTKADGTKFGKSVGGAVWLDPDRTSPWAFWQFLFNSEDAKVIDYLRYFTFRSRDEISALEQSLAEAPGKREPHRVLANDVTSIVHGEADSAAVERAARALFSPDIAAVDERTLGAALAEAPSSTLPGDGVPLLDAVCAAFDLSRGAAAKLFKQNGFSVNNVKESNPERQLTATDAMAGRWVLLRKGKRDQHVLRVERAG